MGHLANRHIGKILLDGRFLSQLDLDKALREQACSKEFLGQVLVRMGVLKAEEVSIPLVIQERLSTVADAVKLAAGERCILGSLLVQSGHITSEQLEYAISEQNKTGEKIGEVFKRLGVLTERQLNALLDFQLNQEGTAASPLKLGELLVATGQITRKQLEEVLLRQTLTKKKLGELLVETGYVHPGQIKNSIRLQKMFVNAVVVAILSLGISAVGSAGPLADSTFQTEMKNALDETGEFSSLSPNEAKLFRLINEYRESNGLPAIANARSLNKVARLHAIDLAENNPATGKDRRGSDCSLHSWSNVGVWSPVCYTKDHAYAEAMWDKPREITGRVYTGDGYENVYSTSEKNVNPERVLNAWKASPSHNAIILEKSIWSQINLLSLGVGIYKNHAVIWVGTLTDPLGPMQASSSVAD